ncbi:hypothetical protein FXO37_21864 [Capsicum annuum]|nr:hypothetical protein FXO37_21864 [Capsicum annuum]
MFQKNKASKLTFSVATKQKYLEAKDASLDVSLMAIGSSRKCTKNYFFLKRDWKNEQEKLTVVKGVPLAGAQLPIWWRVIFIIRILRYGRGSCFLLMFNLQNLELNFVCLYTVLEMRKPDLFAYIQSLACRILTLLKSDDTLRFAEFIERSKYPNLPVRILFP